MATLVNNNQNANRKPCFKFSWAMLAIVCLLVAVLCAVGGTYAAVAGVNHPDDIEAYPNGKLINKGIDSGETLVYPGLTIGRTAVAKNEGSQDMYVRMQYEKLWIEKDEESGNWVESSDDTLRTDMIEVALNESPNWVDGGDGWYYYNVAIAPGTESETFLNNIKFADIIGEDQNDNWYHEARTSTNYVGKAAEVSITMQCAAQPLPQAQEVTETTSYNNGTATATPTGASTASAKTGDSLSPVAIALFALAAISFVVCLFALIAAKRKQREAEQEQEQVIVL